MELALVTVVLLLLAVVAEHVLCQPLPARYHVEERGTRFVFCDEEGREILFRGINLATLGGGGSDVPINTKLYSNGSCPANNNDWYQPPICEQDIVDVKRAGFDSVRLLVHWSQVEPRPGKYDKVYLARLNQIIDWAGESGLDVVVDFHQDNYANNSHACCADDGAPSWAWLVNETRLSAGEKLEISLMKKIIPQLDWDGAEVAFHAFWTNVPVPETKIGLQTHYIQAFAAVVNATMYKDAVIGYEIMNEPLPGLDINLFDFADNFLYPFCALFVYIVLHH